MLVNVVLHIQRVSVSHMTKFCKSPNVKVDILYKTKAISLIEKSMEGGRNRGNKKRLTSVILNFFFF